MNWLDDSIVGGISALKTALVFINNIVFFYGITKPSTRYFKDTQKNSILTYLAKLLIFPSFWPLNQLLNLEFSIFKKCAGLITMCFLTAKIIFRSYNFTNIKTFLWRLAHVRIIAILAKVCPLFSKQNFGFDFICFSVLLKIRHD